jgi:hypothetical protein
MSPRARIALIAGGVVALVIAFVIASGSADTSKKQDRADAGATAPGAAATTTTPAAPAETSTTAATAPPPPAKTTPVVEVAGAEPVGGVQRLKYTKGDTIRFTVASDTTDEIHFHGYDVHRDVKAGGSATFTVPATIEGRFVVELEKHGVQIAEVEVDPS